MVLHFSSIFKLLCYDYGGCYCAHVICERACIAFCVGIRDNFQVLPFYLLKGLVMFLLRDILQPSICLIQSLPLSRDRRTGFQMHYTVPTFNVGFWDKICVFWLVRQGSYPLSHLDSSDLFAMFVCLCFFFFLRLDLVCF